MDLAPLHRILLYLYLSTLPNAAGKYFARTEDERVLSVREVCVSLKERGGYEGSLDKLISDVEQFLREAVYRLCDGYSVETEYFTIRVSVGGTWSGADERFDPEKHPISLTIYPHKKLTEAFSHITVENMGIAPAAASILSVTNSLSGAVNETITSNEDIIIEGRNIKITKGEAGCGLFLMLVPAPVAPGATPPAAVADIALPKIVINNPSQIIARVPNVATGKYKLVIKTKYSSGGGKLLKEVRRIESPFTLTKV